MSMWPHRPLRLAQWQCSAASQASFFATAVRSASLCLCFVMVSQTVRTTLMRQTVVRVTQNLTFNNRSVLCLKIFSVLSRNCSHQRLSRPPQSDHLHWKTWYPWWQHNRRPWATHYQVWRWLSWCGITCSHTQISAAKFRLLWLSDSLVSAELLVCTFGSKQSRPSYYQESQQANLDSILLPQCSLADPVFKPQKVGHDFPMWCLWNHLFAAQLEYNQQVLLIHSAISHHKHTRYWFAQSALHGGPVHMLVIWLCGLCTSVWRKEGLLRWFRWRTLWYERLLDIFLSAKTRGLHV